MSADEGNLCQSLVFFARWRKCCVCGRLTLYVDEYGRTSGDVECKACLDIRDELERRLRYTRLGQRVAMHLAALFRTENDNGRPLV
jgi:hypothetical protein